MALDTILEIEDALLQMLSADARFAVLMTSIACVSLKAVGMTGLTAPIAVTVFHRESVLARIRSRLPRVCAVTIGTLGSELSCMFFWLCMTGNTFGRRSLEHIIDMAGFAICTFMRTR